MTDENQWHNVKNILCIRPDNMGDVLMTTPAFRALKESFEGSKITLLTSKAGSIITPFIKEIDETIAFDVPWVKSNTTFSDSKDFQALIEIVQRRKFDAAIIFTVFSQNPLPSALTAFLADIPLRLAYCHEKPYHLLTDWIPDPEPQQFIRHEVQRQLDMVKSIGAITENAQLSCTVPANSKQQALALLEAEGIDTASPWILMHPGASSTKRLYSSEGFIMAGTKLADQGYQIVVTGSESEKGLADSIKSGIKGTCISAAGKLSLAEFIGLIAASPLLISNNTGPVHIASAIGTPIIDLYALTNPQHTPWHVPHKTLYFPVDEVQRDSSVFDEIPKDATELRSPLDIVKAAEELLIGHHQQIIT